MRTDTAAFNLLQNALKAAQLRQQVYANNIANADTPGYKRQDVTFESLLQSQLGVQDGQASGALQSGNVNWGSLAQIQPQIVQDTTSSISNNGNNVSVNNEMVSLAQNQIRYNALIEDMKLRLNRTQQAIGG